MILLLSVVLTTLFRFGVSQPMTALNSTPGEVVGSEAVNFRIGCKSENPPCEFSVEIDGQMRWAAPSVPVSCPKEVVAVFISILAGEGQSCG